MAEHAIEQRPDVRSKAVPAGTRVGGPRHGTLLQLAAMLNTGPRQQALTQLAAMRNGGAMQRAAVQRAPAPNRTGLPDGLKSGVEALSGLSMDAVRVHRNSLKPATPPRRPRTG